MVIAYQNKTNDKTIFIVGYNFITFTSISCSSFFYKFNFKTQQMI